MIRTKIQTLHIPFCMEVIILMCWSIWTTRNDWIFKDLDPLVNNCKRKFTKEMLLLTHMTKPEIAAQIETWINSL